jgi:hypothetical protein
VPPP